MNLNTSSLRDHVYALPIVDTHTHIRPWSQIAQPMDVYTLFNGSGIMRHHWAMAGALSRQDYRQMKRFDDWPSLSAAIEPIRNTAFYRIMLRGLKEVYDLEFDELDEKTLNVLNHKMGEAYQDPEWYFTVLRDKCGIEISCQDSREPMDQRLFAPVGRIDGFVWFGAPGFREKVTSKYGTERTATIEGLTDCLSQEFRELTEAGVVSLKSNNAWGRPLNYEQVSEASAADALAACLREPHPDPRDVNTLGDYTMDQAAQLCAKHDLPMQIHTGPALGTDHYVDYGNPLHLNSFAIRNPNTKMILFHGGGPFVRESAFLATQLPNVYLDLCWVLGPTFLRNVLDEWIELVPQNKLMWGTDVSFAEEAYAVSRNMRQVLSELLTDRVNSGYFSRAAAEEFAGAILNGNARRLLKLDRSER